jgi:ribosomal protein S27E
MARETDIADHIVMQCGTCGMLNVVPRNSADGRICACCSKGLLKPMGYAVLQGNVSRMSIEVNVERDQLDRLINDVAAVNKIADEILQKMEKIKEE